MKKLLTLFVVVCMLFSAIPFIASADDNVQKPSTGLSIPKAPTVEPDENTIYISSKGNDSNPGTKEAPRQSLVKAYNIAVANAIALHKEDESKGNIVTICVLDDTYMTENGSSAQADFDYGLTGGRNWDGTVYIFGQQKEDGSYPTINGTKKAANFLTLGADTVIYNINFDNTDPNTARNFVINAAFHKLTIGNNFSGHGTGKGYCFVTGAVWQYNNTDKNNIRTNADGLPANGASVSIYSGDFDQVHATWRDSLTNHTTIKGQSEVNIYGDTTIRLLQDVTNDNTAKTTIEGDVTFNVYAGTITTFRSFAIDAENVKHTELNISVNADVTVTKDGGLKSKNGFIGNGEAQYCGYQDGIFDGKRAVRFVGIVDSYEEYDAIGFEILANGLDFTTNCKYVYKSIIGEEGGINYTYTAEQLGGNYIFAVAIKGIPTDGDVTFQIRAFVKKGETTYSGPLETITYTGNPAEGTEPTSIRVSSLNLKNNNDNSAADNVVAKRMPSTQQNEEA